MRESRGSIAAASGNGSQTRAGFGSRLMMSPATASPTTISVAIALNPMAYLAGIGWLFDQVTYQRNENVR